MTRYIKKNKSIVKTFKPYPNGVTWDWSRSFNLALQNPNSFPPTVNPSRLLLDISDQNVFQLTQSNKYGKFGNTGEA
jgi:hypothetical protein